jgi:hypothetical protein
MMFKILSIVIVLVVPGTVLAQNRTPQAAPSDPIAALTIELRALRAEIADTARASLRLQLLVARLQLQEQRIMYLDRQRSELSSRVAGVQQQRIALEGAVKMFGDAGGKNDIADGVKSQLALQEASERQLRDEENQVLNSIASEQARWTDLSSRLEELERSLSAR